MRPTCTAVHVAFMLTLRRLLLHLWLSWSCSLCILVTPGQRSGCTLHSAHIWNTAQCTVHISETLHSAHCAEFTVQVHTSANIKGISSFEAEELRTQILCMSSQWDCRRQAEFNSVQQFSVQRFAGPDWKYAKWKICKIRNIKIEVIQLDAKSKMQGTNSPHDT